MSAELRDFKGAAATARKGKRSQLAGLVRGLAPAHNKPMATLSTDLTDADARPYFLWDEQRTVRQLREALASADAGEWSTLVGKLMREARDEDVWKFVTPDQVWQRFATIEPYLGRRRAFSRYLLEGWCRDGYLQPRPGAP